MNEKSSEDSKRRLAWKRKRRIRLNASEDERCSELERQRKCRKPMNHTVIYNSVYATVLTILLPHYDDRVKTGKVLFKAQGKFCVHMPV